jgi:hypothetical protein
MQDRNHITAADLSDEALAAAGFDLSKLNRDAKRKLASVVDLMVSLNDGPGTKKKRDTAEEISSDKRASIASQITAGCRELVQMMGGDTDLGGMKRACEALARKVGSTS